jgi:hypothetical protein
VDGPAERGEYAAKGRQSLKSSIGSVSGLVFFSQEPAAIFWNTELATRLVGRFRFQDERRQMPQD